jgi:cytochrome c oxidase subunit 2
LAVAVGDRSGPTPTFITLLSADANHSFWIPRLTGKTDLIANHPNSTWIDPHEPELYLGQCALYCGTQHAKMLLRAAKPPIIDVNILRAPQSARGFELTRHRSPVIQL